MKLPVVAAALFLSAQIAAIELKPWYERDLELYPRANVLYQDYNLVNSSSGSRHRNAHDVFTTFGISGSFQPWEVWVEMTLADTRHRPYGFDNCRIMGRYQWLSDTVGDPFCLTTGLIVTGAEKRAVHDISSFHHGLCDVELNVSAGKETICLQDWVTRYWGVLGLGMGTEGLPWMRADLAWEKNYCQDGVLRVFLNSLWGFGYRSLSFHHFYGYGNVRHQSIDLGVRLTKISACWGVFYFEYAYRIFARNFPAQTSLFVFNYCYPFGL